MAGALFQYCYLKASKHCKWTSIHNNHREEA